MILGLDCMKREDLLVILNALVEPVFLINANREITLANKPAQTLFGEGLTGRDFVHAIRNPDALKCVDEALAGRTSCDAVISLPAPVRATYKISSVPLDGSVGADGEIVVSLNDISHVLEAEQMRSDFVANVSHELRSPLTALVGGIETLKGAAKDDPTARQRFLDIMEREAARMDRLVGDLLSLSRVEINEHVRPSERVDVVPVVERVVTALETRKGAGRQPIKLDVAAGAYAVPGDGIVRLK